MKPLRFTLYSLLLFCALCSTALATTYYVRTDGSDSNAGTANNAGGAWGTANGAFNKTQVVAGDTVRFQAGTYPGLNSRTNKGDGTAANPITFTCDGTVVIDLLTINGDDYITIHGFEVTTTQTCAQMNPSDYYTAAGILAYSTNHLIIEDCYVHDIPNSGIWLSGSISSLNSNPIVRRNRVARCQTSIWANSAKTGSNALFEDNVITEPWRYLAPHNKYDTDYMVINVGDQITVQRDAHYGATEDQTLSKGTAIGTSTGNTILRTDNASSFFRRQTSNEIMTAPFSDERTLQNLTTGATGTITAYTIGSPTCTITATMSGGTRQNWQVGDVWYIAAYPHLDGIQFYANSSAQTITNCIIQDSYFGDCLEGHMIENTFYLSTLITLRRNVYGPGFPFTVGQLQNKVNGSIIDKDMNLLIENCTVFGWDVGPIYGWVFSTDTGGFTWTARNNIGFNNASVGWTKGSSPFGNPTRVYDYNLVFPTLPSSPGAHDINPPQNPGFVVASPTTHDHVLGADGLWGTSDDGLRLTAGSPAIGNGLGGVDIGAYQYSGANTAPVVAITGPATGSYYTSVQSVPFTGTAIDTQDGTISSGITWSSNLDGALGTGASLSHTLTQGVHTITASRTDSGGLTGTAQIVLYISTSPAVTILTPANTQTFLTSDSVPFTGTAIDPKFGDLSNGITWTSSLDGALGTGASITHALSAGTHTITASRTNSDGVTGSANVTNIAVNAPGVGVLFPGRKLTRIR